jgi:drug/metabolite transporter (DMT)-like permease
MKSILSLSGNSRGILSLLGAQVFITVSDSIIKLLSPELPLFEIMLIRGFISLVVVFIIVQLEGGLATLKTRRPMMHFMRGSMLVLANVFFFLGLASMPFAETVALFFTAPLFICILSQSVLGERVGLSRWLAIIFGLFGVIIMLRPSGEVFRFISLLPVLAALSYAIMTMMTRKLGVQESAGVLTFYIQFAFIVISSIVGLTVGNGALDRYDNQALSFLLRAWSWPSLAQFQLLLLGGVMVSFGAYLISQAYRIGEASVVALFEYASMPYALIVGFYLWGDWPDWVSFVGSGLIIFSGLLVIYLENQSAREPSIPLKTRV